MKPTKHTLSVIWHRVPARILRIVCGTDLHKGFPTSTEWCSYRAETMTSTLDQILATEPRPSRNRVLKGCGSAMYLQQRRP